MIYHQTLKTLAICMITICFLSSCQSTKQDGMSLDQLKPASTDEAEIYSSLEMIQNYINTSQWDKWLELYSDDAILTNGKEQVSKKEMRNSVNGISYKIVDMEVLEKNIGPTEALVRTSMFGNGKKHLESYKFKKIDGKWLIVEETNP